MSDQLEDMYHSEIRCFVEKLIRFLGTAEVKGRLQKYEASLRTAGPLYREYYLRTRHPWWAALTDYFNLEKEGMSVKRHLTDDLKRLGGDAKKITTLQKRMPETVREKYKKDLLDDNAAYAYLFELNIAWHFFMRNYDIKWQENHESRHSEFIVKTPDFEFEVECKRVSADAARKIWRKDFYRFAEKIIQKTDAGGYRGNLDFVLNERLHSNEQFIIKLVNEIFSIIDNGNLKGKSQTSSGIITLDLMSDSGDDVVDLHKQYENLWKRKPPHAHGAIFARSKNGAPVSPIELTLSSLKSDNYIKNMRNTISDAAKKQFSGMMPGLIICFLEGLDDLSEYKKGSALQEMCHQLFLKEDMSHIAAIVYSSESNIVIIKSDERHFNQALTFRNPKCKYEKAKAFDFFDDFI